MRYGEILELVGGSKQWEMRSYSFFLEDDLRSPDLMQVKSMIRQAENWIQAILYVKKEKYKKSDLCDGCIVETACNKYIHGPKCIRELYRRRYVK